MKKETIQPARNLTGSVELPGDKSISHRYAMLVGLAEGTSELRHFRPLRTAIALSDACARSVAARARQTAAR